MLHSVQHDNRSISIYFARAGVWGGFASPRSQFAGYSVGGVAAHTVASEPKDAFGGQLTLQTSQIHIAEVQNMQLALIINSIVCVLGTIVGVLFAGASIISIANMTVPWSGVLIVAALLVPVTF